MSDIQKTTLEKAVKLLNALKVKYAIIDFDGNLIGNLEVKQEEIKRKRSPSKYEHGALANYVRPYLMNLEVGGVAIIPDGDFDVHTLGKSISSTACGLWGNGNATQTTNFSARTVELMRVG